MQPHFIAFSPAHLAALIVVFSVTALGVVLGRKAISAVAKQRLRQSLGTLIVILIVTHFTVLGTTFELRLIDLLPLHLCDFALLLAAYASFTGNRLAIEVLFFWACTGTLLAMVTPPLWLGFPHWIFFDYFLLHGVVLVTACTLVFGFRRYPVEYAWFRAFVATNIYAAVAGVVNLILKTNYLFLCRKPDLPTLLDYFGPWPVYILVCEVLALGLFALLSWSVSRLCREPNQRSG